MSSSRKYSKVYSKRKRILVDNFLGGIAWGVGSIIGATIIIGVTGIIITRSQNAPIIGDVIQVIINDIQEGQEKFDLGE